MINNAREAYEVWAPEYVVWAEWAKPVLFASAAVRRYASLEIPEVRWAPEADRHTALILDLPGAEGVREGLALARAGYRPVPLYNGVDAPNNAAPAVDVDEIVHALFSVTNELHTLKLNVDAPPVFLLDADRMNGWKKQRGTFDNRWCVFPQDMPSAQFLQQQGITRVIVRARRMVCSDDLAHILRRYQEKGIRIFLCDGYASMKETTINKPQQFKSLWYRFQVILGLTRSAAGGFGAHVPESGGSGTRHYGHG